MLEAIIIIIALGGLEITLWWADHKRQADQLATLEAIWVELAILNEERSPKHSGQVSEVTSGPTADLSIPVVQTTSVVAH